MSTKSKEDGSSVDTYKTYDAILLEHKYEKVPLTCARRELLKSYHVYQSRKPLRWVIFTIGLAISYYSAKYWIPSIFWDKDNDLSIATEDFSEKMGIAYAGLADREHLQTFM